MAAPEATGAIGAAGATGRLAGSPLSGASVAAEVHDVLRSGGGVPQAPAQPEPPHPAVEGVGPRGLGGHVP